MTGTPGRESTIQLKKKKGLWGREPGDQARGVPPPQKQKQQLETLKVESCMTSTAEPRTVQLKGGEASTITEALDPYGGTLHC